MSAAFYVLAVIFAAGAGIGGELGWLGLTITWALMCLVMIGEGIAAAIAEKR